MAGASTSVTSPAAMPMAHALRQCSQSCPTLGMRWTTIGSHYTVTLNCVHMLRGEGGRAPTVEPPFGQPHAPGYMRLDDCSVMASSMYEYLQITSLLRRTCFICRIHSFLQPRSGQWAICQHAYTRPMPRFSHANPVTSKLVARGMLGCWRRVELRCLDRSRSTTTVRLRHRRLQWCW